MTHVDTGRKLNVHKTFRGRPGRLLNVLCKFNLRPVATGTVTIAEILLFFAFHSLKCSDRGRVLIV